MNKSIKITCSCGAMLEYTETISELWEEECAYRQESFLEAHEKCLKKISSEEQK